MDWLRKKGALLDSDNKCRLTWQPTPEGKTRFILTKSSIEAYRRAMPPELIRIQCSLRVRLTHFSRGRTTRGVPGGHAPHHYVLCGGSDRRANCGSTSG